MQSALLAQLETDKGELVEEVAREAAAREEERAALAASVDLERSAHTADLQVLQYLTLGTKISHLCVPLIYAARQCTLHSALIAPP